MAIKIVWNKLPLLNGSLFLFLVLLVLLKPTLLSAQIWDSLSTDLRAGSRYNKVHNGKLLVGIRDTVDGKFINNIGFYNGTTWDTLGSGISGALLSSAEFGGNLYIGGYFEYAGASWPDPAADNLAYWDGTQYYITDYHNSGNDVNNLQNYNNELYLGTKIEFDINGITYSTIARYNGISWNEVDGGLSGFAREVLCMLEYNGKLIVGGRFELAGTLLAQNIVSWDGTQWDTLAGGLNYYVRALCVDTVNNVLYAGGSFTGTPPNTTVNYIAKWDGNSWLPVGSGMLGPVYSLTFYKGQLYASTSSSTAGSKLFIFNGSNWVPILPSPNRLIYCLNVYQDALYASGTFDSIGGIPYAGIARYQDTITSVPHQIFSEKLFELFPNPTSDKLEIKLLAKVQGDVQVMITDATGKSILQQEFADRPKIILKLPQEMKNGVYTCRVVIGRNQHSESFVLQR